VAAVVLHFLEVEECFFFMLQVKLEGNDDKGFTLTVTQRFPESLENFNDVSLFTTFFACPLGALP
jgi:hypothetical protein